LINRFLIDDKVYIFEFKVNSSGALAQIKARGYHQKYMNRYNDIYLLGWSLIVKREI